MCHAMAHSLLWQRGRVNTMHSRGLVARHSHEILQPIGDTVQWAQIGAPSQQGVCLLRLLHGQLICESDGAFQVVIVPACAAGTVGPSGSHAAFLARTPEASL